MEDKEIKLVVLVLRYTGEQLLCDVIEEIEGAGLWVQNVVAFAPKPDGTGIMTMPYMPYVEETKFLFDYIDVRQTLTPNESLVNYHTEQFKEKSAIIVPDGAGKLMKPSMMGVD